MATAKQSVSTNSTKSVKTSEINPILLEKSDDLIKAEIQLQRQRLERALREQMDQHRLAQKALLRLLNPFPILILRGIAKGSCYSSSRYCSRSLNLLQHDTPEPSNSSHSHKPALNEQWAKISEKKKGKKKKKRNATDSGQPDTPDSPYEPVEVIPEAAPKRYEDARAPVRYRIVTRTHMQKYEDQNLQLPIARRHDDGEIYYERAPARTMSTRPLWKLLRRMEYCTGELLLSPSHDASSHTQSTRTQNIGHTVNVNTPSDQLRWAHQGEGMLELELNPASPS
ncbi:hypothetical protein EYC84_001838 [Monilinia fructicola]|uniref:Uncharacterized protein n=1 Tax=Monilinia fructicola TaxID=38448 RepID=A0A5M9JVH4_MONFR|nr:hypothetical protein EYC84_001838 [Monilinia fructicola]